MEVPFVYIYSLDFSSYCMLAASVAGTRALSAGLDTAASIPDCRYHYEWGFCSSYCLDHASSENSEWTEKQVTYNYYSHAEGFHDAFPSF